MHTYFITVTAAERFWSTDGKSQETGPWKGKREFQHEYPGI